MCGINGIFAYSSVKYLGFEELIRSRDSMAARGPDGSGHWMSGDNQVGFAHRRLAIIDLSDNGAQPMSNDPGHLTIVFHGEIYNYRELRDNLQKKGVSFRSQSDTEVLLKLYETDGEKMVHKLRGMFAFAIWNQWSKELFLARDPYGIKPIYYSDENGVFRFACQVKALIAGGGVFQRY